MGMSSEGVATTATASAVAKRRRRKNRSNERKRARALLCTSLKLKANGIFMFDLESFKTDNDGQRIGMDNMLQESRQVKHSISIFVFN